MKPDPVKKRLQELVPEVMKLKLGCEVKDHGIYIAKTPDDDEYYFAPLKEDINGEAQVFCVNSIEGAEILGSKLTLAHVLMAIDKIGYLIGSVHAEEGGIMSGDEADLLQLLALWNLSKPYDEQEQPTKDLIASLILK